MTVRSGRAQKSDLLNRQPPEKAAELILNYLRAFDTEIDDKEQLTKRNYFGAMFDVFDEVVRKAKKEVCSVKLPALRGVVSLFSDISEANYTARRSVSASSRKCAIACTAMRAH